jgi:hypothetical protein
LYFIDLRTLQLLCAAAAIGNLKITGYLIGAIIDLKAYNVCGAARLNIAVAFNNTVLAVDRMETGSDVNISDFGQGILSYYAVCNNKPQWCS